MVDVLWPLSLATKPFLSYNINLLAVNHVNTSISHRRSLSYFADINVTQLGMFARHGLILSTPGPCTRDVDYTTFAMRSLQTSNKCVGITGASDVFLSMSETAKSNEPACSHKYQTRTLRFHEAAFSQGMEKKTVTASCDDVQGALLAATLPCIPFTTVQAPFAFRTPLLLRFAECGSRVSCVAYNRRLCPHPCTRATPKPSHEATTFRKN